MKKVLFTATVDSHILAFHIPFLKYFKEKGYEVHVATNGDETIPYCDRKIKISFERNPFKINNIKAIGQLKKVLKKENYDIIHTHTPMGSVVTRISSRLAKSPNTRLIYTAHGLHFYQRAPLINWLLFYPVEKYLSKYTDTLILINQEDYSLAKKKFRNCKNIYYVPGVGIDEEKFSIRLSEEEQRELRISLGLTTEDFILTYPGELNKNKNQYFLIRAIKQLVQQNSHIHLLLAGRDSYHGYYRKLVKKLHLEKNVHFLGFRKDIPQLLSITDLSVSSSKREGLPVNIMEAMYMKLPVVALDCRGARDLVKNGRNGYLICQNDLQMFLSKVLFLNKNLEQRKQLGQNGFYQMKPYLLNSILKEMDSIYKAGEFDER